MMRTFNLLRFKCNDNPKFNETKEVVAEGVEFSDGRCVMHWLSIPSSIAVYDSIDDLIHIHGHGGTGIIVYGE